MKALAETGGRIEELAHEPFEDDAKLQRLPEQHPGLVVAGTYSLTPPATATCSPPPMASCCDARTSVVASWWALEDLNL
jgi:hypothetical protein